MSQDHYENNDFAQRAAEHNAKKKSSVWRWPIILFICLVMVSIVKETFHYIDSNEKGWSPEYTQSTYNSIKEGIHRWTMDSSSKNNLINCIVVKLKNKYPQGLGEVNDDSLKSTTAKDFAVCAVETNVSFRWTPYVDSLFRVKLMGTPFIRDLPKEYQAPFCNCYLKRVKELYPQGFTESLRQRTKDSIITFCTQKVIQ